MQFNEIYKFIWQKIAFRFDLAKRLSLLHWVEKRLSRCLAWLNLSLFFFQ